jgi:hypothetical protein
VANKTVSFVRAGVSLPAQVVKVLNVLDACVMVITPSELLLGQ